MKKSSFKVLWSMPALLCCAVLGSGQQAWADDSPEGLDGPAEALEQSKEGLYGSLRALEEEGGRRIAELEGRAASGDDEELQLEVQRTKMDFEARRLEILVERAVELGRSSEAESARSELNRLLNPETRPQRSAVSREIPGEDPRAMREAASAADGADGRQKKDERESTAAPSSVEAGSRGIAEPGAAKRKGGIR